MARRRSTGARARHALVEPALSGAAGRSDPHRGRRRTRRSPTTIDCCTQRRQDAGRGEEGRRRASSATGCSTRCGARRSRWSRKASATPRPSTTSSSRASARGSRCSGRSRTPISSALDLTRAIHRYVLPALSRATDAFAAARPVDRARAGSASRAGAGFRDWTPEAAGGVCAPSVTEHLKASFGEQADKESTRGQSALGQGHHHLRGHRRHSYADHVGARCRSRPTTSPRNRSPRRRPAPSILHLHARDPKDGRPTPDPAVFMQFLPRIKQATDAVINITTGGGLNMTVEERLAAPLRRQAGDVLAQHGLDEFRHLSARRPLQDLEVRLGRALSARHRRLHLPQHVPRHRAHPQDCSARTTARASSTNATMSATSTTSPISSTASWSSRRSSCR